MINLDTIRDLLVDRKPIKPVPVSFPDLPSLDGQIFVRFLPLTERIELDRVVSRVSEARRKADVEPTYMDTRIIMAVIRLCACSEDGTLLFNDDHICLRDGKVIVKETFDDPRFILPLSNEALSFNNYYRESKDSMVKNSEGTQTSST